MDFLVIGSSIAFIAYMLATLAILSRLFHPKGPNLNKVLVFAVIAITTHIFNDAQLLFSQDSINFSLPNVISLVSLVITIAISLIALRMKVNLLLPVIYGFAGIWQLMMIFIPKTESIPLMAEKVILVGHISIALIAYCILIIATLYTFQVAYINLKLKNKNLTAVIHLPPLMQVEKQLFTILMIGTTFLFASQLIGLLFLDGFWAKENLHKTVLSLIALAIYIIILAGHFYQGWRGHRVLLLTIMASTLLTLSYFGSRFVKEFMLS
ncbi:cytochrome C assembly family protein [Candidatus Colwellia aromaticivorans]|uniref:cytochrome C assembly family protein n=1 Tax=Candidatus Colwellia aromaticivorans TaxID=2267621 RepID=UPI000DF4B50E|nr:cytochrome c biogenesis protein CcsA [Candidatus Colwellia aromaticivorans]